MKKHTILTVLTAAFALLVTGCNCCNADDDASANGCKNSQPCPANAVKKAVTPNGEVIYIVAVWNANCESMPPGKGCKTAQCWQTSDGKTLCVKPLKKCKSSEKAEGQCFKTSDGTTMTTQTDNKKVLDNSDKQHWAAKQLQNCPANGNAAACKAPEHAAMPNGKPGCAKADVKHAAEAKANIPMPLQDTVVEEDYFIATTGD
ncbi:MAG: hypothetical protein IJV89_00305 [Lentisphaeria bacterium]|nr:hypothetical protein [Lentisphaeria bacterium]